ncbi:MAG TPA: hypothetical protein VMV01_12285, partial [Planctomycetota bacterium]|nr:hypothetical protein [Planctomycetota bacterium]
MGLLASTAAAWAAWPDGPVETLISQASSPTELRSRLTSQATRLEKSDPAGAGEAWYHAGRSYARASLRDSAIACWRKSLALRKENQDRHALADALIQRRASGDLDEAGDLLKAAVAELQGQPGTTMARFVALLAWDRYLAGAETEARELFAQVEPSISSHAIWRFRYARALAGTEDWHKI